MVTSRLLSLTFPVEKDGLASNQTATASVDGLIRFVMEFSRIDPDDSAGRIPFLGVKPSIWTFGALIVITGLAPMGIRAVHG